MALSNKQKDKFKYILLKFQPFVDRKLRKGMKYSENLNFRDDLGFDSLDEIEFLMEIEKQFNVGISDQKAKKIKTVGDALKVLNSVL
jgi:acyl carrier protein